MGLARGAMSDRITADMVEEVALMLKNSERHRPVSVWNAIKELLISRGLAYTVELSAELLLCHPDNRGGLGPASARNLVAWPASTASSAEALVFAEVAATPKKKTISFGLAGDVDKTVVVKRPSHPCDRLALIMKAESLDNVFTFMRFAGFAGEAEKKTDVPAGI